MVSSCSDDVNVSNKSDPNIKNGVKSKGPRKIVKAEREKSKRDHMNVLFQELGEVLEPAIQSNGKASLLNETIRLVKELISQIDCLTKENHSLLSESHYITVEKDELKEETSALETQIEKLKNEINERNHMQSYIQVLPEEHHGSVISPVFVGPGMLNVPKVSSNVSRPRPRYPSQTDSWPTCILAGEGKNV